MKSRLSFVVFVIIFSIGAIAYVQADQDLLEQRVDRLEDEIRQLRRLFEVLTDEHTERPRGTEDGSFESPSNDNSGATSDPVSGRLTSIAFRESNALNNWANDFRDWIEMDFEFTNNLDSEIRAVRGAVEFYDLFDDLWWTITITVNDPIASGATILWNGSITYSSFNAQHRIARNTRASDVSVQLTDVQIVSIDGERIEF